MPDSLKRLDLSPLTVVKAHEVHPDGTRFGGRRYIAPTVAAPVVGGVGEVRVFHIAHERAGGHLSPAT
jgi:hypothetical protein